MPRLPFIGAYAIQVPSLAAVGNADPARAALTRAGGGALVVPFPAELGIGAWLFVENGRDLPWRA